MHPLGKVPLIHPSLWLLSPFTWNSLFMIVLPQPNCFKPQKTSILQNFHYVLSTTLVLVNIVLWNAVWCISGWVSYFPFFFYYTLLTFLLLCSRWASFYYWNPSERDLITCKNSFWSLHFKGNPFLLCKWDSLWYKYHPLDTFSRDASQRKPRISSSVG